VAGLQGGLELGSEVEEGDALVRAELPHQIVQGEAVAHEHRGVRWCLRIAETKIERPLQLPPSIGRW
jgi:hypothetical protein